ncbi:MAG: hypothetical protein SGJ24_10500 [Chloroflexota bacterium]|nr:hypothetical protein [Chloroflexota bacterium]
MFSRKTVFFIDALLFTIGGIFVLFASSPQNGMVPIITPDVVRPFEDTRRWLASQFLTVAMFLWLSRSSIVNARTRNWACRIRCVSLVVMFATHVSMLASGAWYAQWIVVPMIYFTVMFCFYLYFGFIKPEADSSTAPVAPPT